ncbi:MAG: hypothetical protein ACI8Y7_000528 [Candidatus Woesearchaeota archaeon]|jgi:hypothetical protein
MQKIHPIRLWILVGISIVFSYLPLIWLFGRSVVYIEETIFSIILLYQAAAYYFGKYTVDNRLLCIIGLILFVFILNGSSIKLLVLFLMGIFHAMHLAYYRKYLRKIFLHYAYALLAIIVVSSFVFGFSESAYWNKNIYAQVLVLLFVIFLSYKQYFASLVSFILVLLSYSKTGIILCFFAMFLYVYLRKKILLSIILLLLVISAGLFLTIDNTSFTGRTSVWVYALDAISYSPIVGYSYLSFWDDDLILTYETFYEIPNAHNGYLDILLSGGILLFLLFAYCLYKMISGSFVILTESKNPTYLLFILVLGISLVYNLFESIWFRPYNIYTTLFFLSYILIVPESQKILSKKRR